LLSHSEVLFLAHPAFFAGVHDLGNLGEVGHIDRG
jgi:hypothetical protein